MSDRLRRPDAVNTNMTLQQAKDILLALANDRSAPGYERDSREAAAGVLRFVQRQADELARLTVEVEKLRAATTGA